MSPGNENYRYGPAQSSYPSYTPQVPRSHSSAAARSSSVSSNGSTGKQVSCEWGGGHCSIPIEDSSPSGIARHLRTHHDIPVNDNHHRQVCIWGTRGCGKDMFPSSFGKHIAECHLRNMTKQCPYCHADFARADTLSRHIKGFCHSTGQQNARG